MIDSVFFYRYTWCALKLLKFNEKGTATSPPSFFCTSFAVTRTARTFSKKYCSKCSPKWRNWHTRRSQKPVPQGLWVRLPPSAPFFHKVVFLFMPRKKWCLSRLQSIFILEKAGRRIVDGRQKQNGACPNFNNLLN